MQSLISFTQLFKRSTTRTMLKRGLVFVLIAMMIVPSVSNVLAATYTFTQTDWSGGPSTTTAIHPTNQINWNTFESASTSVVTSNAGQISLIQTSSTTVQTSDIDFSGGTHSNTTITGTGAEAIVTLGSGVSKLASNYYAGFGIKTDGTVLAFGTSIYGSLGTNASSSHAFEVPSFANAVSISGNYAASYMIKTDGTVWSLGRNNYGQLGDGTLTDSLTPVQVSGLTNVIAIEGGYDFALALKSDGTVWAWGLNTNGQLGDNTIVNKSTPVQVKDSAGTGYLTGITSISAGYAHAFAIQADGGVWAWGYNVYKGLGDNTAIQRNLPVRVMDPAGTGVLTGITSIAAGNLHAIALKSDGTVWAWGYNGYGQLGNFTTTLSGLPVQVKGTGGVGFLTGITAIESGETDAYALKSDGTVWAWGRNNYGQLGDGTIVQKTAPVQTTGISSVTALTTRGIGMIYALKSDGTVWSWGLNTNFQLANNTAANSSIPTQVFGPPTGTLNTALLPSSPTSTTLVAGTNISFAVKSDGTVGVWGSNMARQLGFDDQSKNKTSPMRVPVLTNVTSVAGSFAHSLAIKNDGTLWAWGGGSSGQLGRNSLSTSGTPVQVMGVDAVGTLTNIISASGGLNHSLAVKSDGTVWAWGSNSYGQLGTSTTITAKYTPIQVLGLSNAIAVAAGQNFSLALKSDGTVWAWGYNISGQLGNGGSISTATPVQVSSLTNVTSISAGQNHSLALRNDGTVWAWGHNGYGQLGDGTINGSTIPVQVSVMPAITSISAGFNHSLAAKSDGTVWAWGSNEYGQLGDGSIINAYSPVQIAGLTNIVSVTGGTTHSLALKNNGEVWAWGYNDKGQLSDLTTDQRLSPVLSRDWSLPTDYLNLGGGSLPSGTYTSSVIDTNQVSNFDGLDYTFTTPSGADVFSMEVRGGLTATPDGSWTAWQEAPVNWEGGNIRSVTVSSINGNRYMQYRLAMQSIDGISIPGLDDATLYYSGYPTEGVLTSSVYDMSNPLSIPLRLQWTESLPTSTAVKFQITDSNDGINWTGWHGSDGTQDTYFTLADGSQPFSGSQLQFIQYRAFLTSDGTGTPVLSDTTLTYVVNAVPELASLTAAQIADPLDPNFGKVLIEYAVRDPDTLSGSVTAGFVTPLFYYTDNSMNGGMVAIDPATLSLGATDNKAVSEIAYTTYQAVWDAKAQLGEFYSPLFTITLTVDDNEPLNNVGGFEAPNFTLDVAAPTVTRFRYNGDYRLSYGQPSLLEIRSTDNSTFTFRYSNNEDLSPDGVNPESGIALDGALNPTYSILNYVLANATSGPSTIFYEFVDVLGNRASGNYVAPAPPTNFKFRDTSDINIDDFQITLSWDAYMDNGSVGLIPFDGYYLYRSTSTDEVGTRIYYSSEDPSINTYVDTGLDPNTTYYYRVGTYLYLPTNTGSIGMVSLLSPILNDLPNGQGGTDLIPPTITNVQVAETQTTWAKITWTTDELSDSTIDYGVESLATSTTNTAMVTDHSVIIENLEPETTYLFRARSSDSVLNTRYGEVYSFTTAAGPKITDVTAINVASQGATIFWNTDKDSNSYVNYSTNADLSASFEVSIAELVAGGSTATGTFQHRVDLSGLQPGTTYYYYVKSFDAFNNVSIEKNSAPYYSFKTTQDRQAPIITDVTAPVISTTATVISWKTDEPSTSQVDYGTEVGTFTVSTALDTVFSTYHVVSITGLSPEKEYFYRVRSKDDANNEGTSSQSSFITTKGNETIIIVKNVGGGSSAGTKADTIPPVISNIQVASTTAFSATITFDTDEVTTGFVGYDRTEKYSFEAGDSIFSKTHAITIPNLRLGTDYHFAVKAVDKTGNTASSKDLTFKTKFFSEDLKNLTSVENAAQFQEEIEQSIESILPSIVPPFIETPVVTDITENSAVVTWKTNTRGYSVVSYAPEKTYDTTKTNPYVAEASNMDTKGTEHSISLTGLEPNTTYHFAAKSFALPGAIGSSKDMTFITKASKTQATVFDVKNTSLRVTWATEEPASTVVEYTNMKTGIIKRTIDSARKVSHDILVDQLTPATRYSVSVVGYTANGNIIESGSPIEVTTSQDIAAPKISNFKVDGALVPGRTDRIQTIVTWTTDEPSSGIVEYQEGSGSVAEGFANKVAVTDNFVTNHVVILPNLKPGTIYQFKITSADQADNSASFGPRTIITPQKGESIFDVIFKNFEDTFKFLRNVGQ